MRRKKVVIIGAGPAGLTAAYEILTRTDAQPVILEESGHIGGISRTAVCGNNRIDIGGHRFFTKNDRIMALWTDLMPLQGAPAADDKLLGRKKPLKPDGPDPERTEAVMLVRDRVSRIYFMGKFFDYPIAPKWRTIRNMGIARTAQAAAGYMASVVRKRAESTLEDFYINRFGRPLYEMFFEHYTQKVWGVHPSRISPEWGAQRVRGLSLSKAALSGLSKKFTRDPRKGETSLIDRFYYPKRGPGQLWEEMAGRIARMGGEIRLNARVTDLNWSDGGIESARAVRDGIAEEHRADAFFSSMPVRDLIASMGPKVPGNVKEIAKGLAYRDFITVGLLLRKLNLRNETKLRAMPGLVPDCWIYIQERGVKIGRLQIFNNWSPYMVGDMANTVWIGLEYFCCEGDGLWNMPEREFTRFAADELASLGVIRRADVLDTAYIRVKKAYPAYFGTYGRFPAVRGFLDGFSNLYCIGRNGQHRYNNMDHSMLTAMEAVSLWRAGTADKTALWSVNAEEAYHESRR